jgi:hypothetical protein
MTENPKHARPAFRSALVAFASFLLILYWLVVATYPEFFLFNPFSEAWWPRQFTLVLSLIGWIAISTVPTFVLYSYSAGSPKALKLLPLVALFWPGSVVLNQVLLFARDGVWYFDYLLNHPIFIATDIALPALLLFLYFDLKVEIGRHAQASAD